MAVPTENPHKSRRSGIQAPVAVTRSLRAVTERALGKVGQGLAQLLSQWPQIVGPDIAKKCLPTALNFPRGKNANAVLHVTTSSAFALELSHQKPKMIERINGFLGYGAIADLRFDHAHLPSTEYKRVTAAVRGGSGQAHTRNEITMPTEICQIYDEIKDPELREKLKSLCRAVAAA